MSDLTFLKDVGWNSSVPPNGFINRPESSANNDNPDGLSTAASEIEIETTPEHLNPVSGDPNCATWIRDHDEHSIRACGVTDVRAVSASRRAV